jgi:hypothetical protein
VKKGLSFFLSAVYEREFSEDSDTNSPGGFVYLFGAPFLNFAFRQFGFLLKNN